MDNYDDLLLFISKNLSLYNDYTLQLVVKRINLELAKRGLGNIQSNYDIIDDLQNNQTYYIYDDTSISTSSSDDENISNIADAGDSSTSDEYS